MKILSGWMDRKDLPYRCRQSQKFRDKLSINIWIQSHGRKPVLQVWVIGKMSSQWLRVKMEEGISRGVCVMGCTDFDTYIFPGHVKRPELWVWTGKKSSRAKQRNSQVSSIQLCSGRRLPKIVCVYVFEKWNYVRNLRHICQLVNAASSCRVVWKDHQIFVIVTLAHLHPVLWQQPATDTWIWVENSYISPGLLSLLLTKKNCIYLVALHKFRLCSFIAAHFVHLTIIQNAKGSRNLSQKFSW